MYCWTRELLPSVWAYAYLAHHFASNFTMADMQINSLNSAANCHERPPECFKFVKNRCRPGGFVPLHPAEALAVTGPRSGFSVFHISNSHAYLDLDPRSKVVLESAAVIIFKDTVHVYMKFGSK
ncbi:hypothetical protein PoB_005643800 [Plakobranchus ocellatus]|uniref:Uncharacterized protein n=1 Tax=Plakobranchus ocellatus TaxID=259542 RepID=A0AAV4CDF1_9GAST|nr:hypothetical protein PoB_005643800 [Plakobranchus ocellatus]